MSTSVRLNPLAGALLLALSFSAAHAASLTYQGNLQDGGKPANGNYDIRLTLYANQTGGAAIGAPVTLYGVPVHDGTFSTEVDFGTAANSGSPVWVGAAVAPAGSGAFTTLDSRTEASLDEPSGTCDSYWSLSGNSGNPSGSFLGTSDNEPLVLKAYGVTLATFTGSSNDSLNSVALGNSTAASGFAAFAAGDDTIASGAAATALGANSTASAHVSFAAGSYARATHAGSFVWADDTSSTPWGDTANDQFLIRAAGGVGINTATSLDGGPLEDALTVGDNGTGTVRMTMDDTSDGYSWTFWTGGSGLWLEYQDGSNDIYPATFANSGNSTGLNGAIPSPGAYALKIGSDTTDGNGVTLSPGGTWSNGSSRTFKEDFQKVDDEAVLAKVVDMPVETWFYKKSHAEGRHMGPFAEDFAAAFKLGSDNKHITTVDEAGVAFAAIKGLNQKLEHDVKQIADENAALKAQNATLAAKLAQLDTRMATLEVAQHGAGQAAYQVAQRGE